MMQQYLTIKEQHKDEILFFRLGDFYEMFFEDAKIASRELELVLTGKSCGQDERAPMCGIPYHAAENYIAKLVAKGYKVAICEQTEDPALAKGIVSRDIIRIVTPGTVTESTMLDEGANNYLACLCVKEEKAGIAFCDISTGETYVYTVMGDNLGEKIVNGLARFMPSELLANVLAPKIPELRNFVMRKHHPMADVLADEHFDFYKCKAFVEEHFSKTVESLGLADNECTVSALGAMLEYLVATQKNSLENITEINVYSEEKYLFLNEAARRNLELTETQRRREKKGSLLWVLDKTGTAMGKRKLRAWVEQPLVNVSGIIYRQNAIEELFNNNELRFEQSERLSSVNDMERILTRIVYGSANARDLKTLSQTFGLLPDIKSALEDCRSGLLKDIYRDMDLLGDIHEMIEDAIADEPPFSVHEGGMIRTGYSQELDELRTIVNGGKDFLSDIESKEQEKTGIKKLKIGYNRVFGYYIEVPNSYKSFVPEDYIRKQTLSGCERYITPELKELESKVLGAQERITKLENELFNEIAKKTAREQDRIRITADVLATLDAICSLASVAAENGYVRPQVNNSGIIDIKDGRHPVVEKFLDGAPFVPNDTFLDADSSRTMIITGPNMAGKSTYMRQTAVIVLMAQIGSFVPAKSATVGIVDSIFTRVGASDDLVGGQSTFMTEMSEVSSILSSATSKSLIILDEIGRGTSTFDGMSIARAVLEYVTDKKKIGAKTMFATHYHELTALENEIDGVKNYNTTVKKRGDDVTFLRRIVRGAADGSYGIEVAKLSGIPQSVVNRAKVILKGMEENGEIAIPKSLAAGVQSGANQNPEYGLQADLFSNANNAVTEELKELDLNTLTPIEALTKLYELKNKLI